MILVTGAKGFIGRCVCSTLSAHGKNLVALDQHGPTALTDASSYPLIECDIRDREQIARIFSKYSFTVIVHLASLLNTASAKNPVAATQVNVLGSLNLLEASRQFQASKFIYGSSISVYGEKSFLGQRGIVETQPAEPEGIYGATKRYVEILGENYRQHFGIQFIALRISSVLGPGALNTASPWRNEIFEKLGSRHRVELMIPYRSDESLPLVHVEDVASMLERLVDAQGTSFTVYNTPSETWQLGDLATYVRSLNGNLQLIFGQSAVSGIPKMVDGWRFEAEFNYTPVSLRERLRMAA